MQSEQSEIDDMSSNRSVDESLAQFDGTEKG